MRVSGEYPHYKMRIEPWDAMEAWFLPDEFEGFLRGNIIKYLARYRTKGGLDDLVKAHHYLEKLIVFKQQEGPVLPDGNGSL